jgi:hypothetical protein
MAGLQSVRTVNCGNIASRSEIIGDDRSASTRAHQIAPDVDPAKTSLLIAAHSTDLNKTARWRRNAKQKDRALGKYAAVLNVYGRSAARVDCAFRTQT